MSHIGLIWFVALDEAPSELELSNLPTAEDVSELIHGSFAPYCTYHSFEFITATTEFHRRNFTGFHLIYIYGHVWLDTEEPFLAIRETQNRPTVISGEELVHKMLSQTDVERAIVIFDCCHAEAFDRYFKAPIVPRLSVFASSKQEKAISLHGSDNASRLAIGISKGLSNEKEPFDLLGKIISIAMTLRNDDVVIGQTVGYRASGREIVLDSTKAKKTATRESTVRRIRNRLLLFGSSAALAIVSLGWFYWSHALVQIDLNGLLRLSDQVNLTISVEEPENNTSELGESRNIQGNQMRLWVPARNVIIRIEALYKDDAERQIRYHLLLRPSFDFLKKLVTLELPHWKEVRDRPGMAYIPASAWYRGEDRVQSMSESFWIDIEPPSVKLYSPLAQQLQKLQLLKQENSILLSSISTTDSGSGLNVLNKFDPDKLAIDEDYVVGDLTPPCDACPAVMTRYEAEVFCVSQNKRIPNDYEWELAVRGVDGRNYPWGNNPDKSKVNAPGLPEEIGKETSLEIKPVNQFPHVRSPFGLVDTVGNAGDWVSADYPRTFMGGTYKQNPEDAVTYGLLPVTEVHALQAQDVTARCVATAKH
ncbi:SUMF1/EgtB/PvdO family nonheme iron enzyme [Vibrio diabolicus]|uniref:SUMF1/EgtB/PvdO family nonheme iron enzyme n=1 Tax=Vibrio diabolicus TaxID=50719 RepID=UPI00373E920B